MHTQQITLTLAQWQSVATLAAIAKTADDVTPVLRRIALYVTGPNEITATTTDRYRVGAITLQTEHTHTETEQPQLIHHGDLTTALTAYKKWPQNDTLTIVTEYDTKEITTQNGPKMHSTPTHTKIGRQNDTGQYWHQCETIHASYPPILRLLADHKKTLETAPAAGEFALNAKFLADVMKLRAPGETTRDASQPWKFHTAAETGERRRALPVLATRTGKQWRLEYMQQPTIMPTDLER
jgi:hypothetical protein